MLSITRNSYGFEPLSHLSTQHCSTHQMGPSIYCCFTNSIKYITQMLPQENVYNSHPLLLQTILSGSLQSLCLSMHHLPLTLFSFLYWFVVVFITMTSIQNNLRHSIVNLHVKCSLFFRYSGDGSILQNCITCPWLNLSLETLPSRICMLTATAKKATN